MLCAFLFQNPGRSWRDENEQKTLNISSRHRENVGVHKGERGHKKYNISPEVDLSPSFSSFVSSPYTLKTRSSDDVYHTIQPARKERCWPWRLCCIKHGTAGATPGGWVTLPTPCHPCKSTRWKHIDVPSHVYGIPSIYEVWYMLDFYRTGTYRRMMLLEEKINIYF